jgi:hypothetical protein
MLFVAEFDTAAPGIVLTPAGDPQWALVDEVFSLNGVPANFSVTELTHLLSTGWAKEKIPGNMDAGQLTFRFNYSSSLFTFLQGKMPSTVRTAPDWGRKEWILQLPDGGQMELTAFINGMPFTVPEDNRVEIEVTLEISGRPLLVVP